MAFSINSPVLYVITICVLVLVLTQAVTTLRRSLRRADELGIDKKVYSLSIPLGATVNMDGTTIYMAVFGLLLAWVLVRYEFPGKRLLDALMLAVQRQVVGVLGHQHLRQ